MSGARYLDLSHRLIANSVIQVGGKLTCGTECWEWCAQKDTRRAAPYGKIGIWNSKIQRMQSFWVHRISYEWFREDKIPLGMEVDHLCGNTLCINPGHFELVTKEENITRRDAVSLTEKIYDISGYIEALDSDYENRALSHAGWIAVQHLPSSTAALGA